MNFGMEVLDPDGQRQLDQWCAIATDGTCHSSTVYLAPSSFSGEMKGREDQQGKIKGRARLGFIVLGLIEDTQACLSVGQVRGPIWFPIDKSTNIFLTLG